MFAQEHREAHDLEIHDYSGLHSLVTCLAHWMPLPEAWCLAQCSPVSASKPLLVCVLSHSTGVQLFVTLLTVAHHAPLSMGFSRQEY